MKFAIIGAGSWGLAIGHHLASLGHDVLMQCRTDVQAQHLSTTKTDKRIPDIKLHDKLQFSNLDFQHRIGVECIILACPSKVLRGTCRNLNLAGAPSKGTICLSLIKGIEKDTGLRVSEIIDEEVSWLSKGDIAVLSGPSLAKEVLMGTLTTVVIASSKLSMAHKLQNSFNGELFRVYTSDDVLGVELGGALKNVVALAAGMIEGLGFGDNTVGALITRGLSEISRLGECLGASPQTFSGLSGLGDLVTTCMSSQSRNRKVGVLLGQGMSLEKILNELGMVAEGVYTAVAAVQMAERYSIDMPVAQAVYNVLYKGGSAADEAKKLMRREPKTEIF
ncbi:NAD(P)-dependent glycerol-3-phosphate dehydrogenase [Fibrobacterales bacterium]|nr:NAD(P)-dependent glycerol-3-phosphate dehydrogenase [Fibrobacterales bacterium]